MAVKEANLKNVSLLQEEKPAVTNAETKKDAVKGTVLTSLAAGAVAGAVAKSTIAPLDRTKIQFQINREPYTWRAAIQYIQNAIKTDGFLSMWRGNSATMARIVPYCAVQFASHEQWKRVLVVDTPASARKHPIRHLIAGSLAGVTSQSATYPLDMARARMAVFNQKEYQNIVDVFRNVYKQEGFRALYKGYPVTVLGVVPYAGVSFFTYESLKHEYLEMYGILPNGMTKLAMGGVAGALGQSASYPLDIVRRRMQTSRYKRPTAICVIQDVWENEGWRGFFKGLSMNWLKGPISVGISFATYDFMKTVFKEFT